MTAAWDRVLATGSGKLNFRLQIEGFPYEAVTDRAMEGVANAGRKRYAGLVSDRFQLKEKVDLVRAKWEPDGFRVSFIDRKRQWTEAFRKPTAVTHLAADLTTAAATASVLAAGAFSQTAGRIYTDTETISYTSVDTSGTLFQGLSRGTFDSLNQKHFTVDGARARRPEVTDWPRVREGRRVTLWVYAEGDDLTDGADNAGTQIWTGVVSTEPQFDGLTWGFSVDPITRKWDADVGSDLADPATIRGIYYPDASPLVLYIAESSDTSNGGSKNHETVLALSGFWEDQESFVVDLNTHINTAMTNATVGGPFTQNVTAATLGRTWCLEFETTGTPRGMIIKAESATDRIDHGDECYIAGTTTRTSTVAASTRYRLTQGDPLGWVPRATIGNYTHRYMSDITTAIPAANTIGSGFSSGRIYLSGHGINASVNSIEVEWESNGLDGDVGGRGGDEGFIAPVSVDTSNRYIQLTSVDGTPFEAGGPRWRPTVSETWYSAISSGAVSLRLGAILQTGHLGNFLVAVTNNLANLLNTGTAPDIRASDFHTLTDNDLAAAAITNVFGGHRVFSLWAPVAFSEVVEQECRLLGVYPCYDSAGLVTFRKLRLPAPGESATTIDASHIINGDGEWLTYELAPLGMFNTVEVSTGYNSNQDDYLGRRQVVRDVDAYSRNPDARTLQIMPKSGDLWPPSAENMLALATPILSVFGGPYAYLTIAVNIKLFAVLLGDVVSVTHNKVPNSDGTLGVTGQLGIVVAREWELMKGVGKLTILMTDRKIGGYTPSSKISGIAGTSGTTGPFTANASSDYFPGSEQASDHFSSGDLIRLFRYDDTSTATNVLGTLDADPTGNSISFTTDSNWTHTGSTWVLGARVSTAITAAGQKAHAFVANADGTVDFSGDTGNAAYELL